MLSWMKVVWRMKHIMRSAIYSWFISLTSWHLSRPWSFNTLVFYTDREKPTSCLNKNVASCCPLNAIIIVNSGGRRGLSSQHLLVTCFWKCTDFVRYPLAPDKVQAHLDLGYKKKNKCIIKYMYMYVLIVFCIVPCTIYQMLSKCENT